MMGRIESDVLPRVLKKYASGSREKSPADLHGRPRAL